MKSVANTVGPAGEGMAVNETADAERLERIIAALRTVFDPEIPTNIYDLGLVYAIDAVSENDIHIRMTLTAPGCPVAGILPGQVEKAVESVEGVGRCHVELVWDPPWNKDMMSDEAKLELGMM
jgi:FeS assembly SUF system protein